MLEAEHGLQEREKETGKGGLGQDKESVKLDMRQTIVKSCALDEHRRATAAVSPL